MGRECRRRHGDARRHQNLRHQGLRRRTCAPFRRGVGRSSLRCQRGGWNRHDARRRRRSHPHDRARKRADGIDRTGREDLGLGARRDPTIQGRNAAGRHRGPDRYPRPVNQLRAGYLRAHGACGVRRLDVVQARRRAGRQPARPQPCRGDPTPNQGRTHVHLHPPQGVEVFGWHAGAGVRRPQDLRAHPSERGIRWGVHRDH
jgi:hypothetical protein